VAGVEELIDGRVRRKKASMRGHHWMKSLKIQCDDWRASRWGQSNSERPQCDERDG
jgi:hypothetical protein